jgi:hypothetical protein
MAIRHKRKTTTGYTWLTTDLVDGQLGVNTTDGTLHLLNAGATSVFKFITIPSQTGHNGQYLTTDGSNISWSAVSGGSSVPDYFSNTYAGAL